MICPDPRDRTRRILLALFGLVLSATVFASAWFTSGRHFMLPLDDSYIHLQYARMLAHGQPYSYWDGAPPSGGATSPAWVILLTPPFLLRLEGVAGALWAYALATGILISAAILIGEIVRRLATRGAALLAGVLFLANGHMLWNFLSGMETGLFATLLLLAVYGLMLWREDGSTRGRTLAFIALAATPLARPEGFILLAVVVAILAIQRRESFAYWIARGSALAIPGLLNLLAMKLLVGEWKPAGMISKGLFDRTDIGIVAKAGMVAQTLYAVPIRFYRNIVPDDGYAMFKGTNYLPYLPEGLALIALVAGIAGAVGEWRARRLGAFTLLTAIWLAGAGSLAASAIPFIHQQRYLAPWTPIAIVLACAGLHRLREAARLPRITVGVGGAALLVLSLPSVPFWVLEYGRNANDIYAQHREMSFSVAADERVAITDTGVLVYYTQAHADDLVGLTTGRFTRAWLVGEAATLEELADSDPIDRPATLITYREWFSDLFPLGPAIHGKWLSVPTIAANRLLARYPIDWRRIDHGRQITLTNSEHAVSEVNVGSLRSEKLSNYKWAILRDDERPMTWPRPNVPLGITPSGGIVGGRFVRHEEFDLVTLKGFARRNPTLIARIGITAPDSSPAGITRKIELTATSLDSGLSATMTFDIPDAPPYVARDVRVPLRDLLDRAGGTTKWRIRMRGAEPASSAWLSFHYLFVESGEQK